MAGRSAQRLLFALLILLATSVLGPFAFDSVAGADDFALAKPQSASTLKKLTLHVSQYHVVHARPANEVELLDIDDRPLGIAVSRADFCTAALQGTVEIGGAIYSVSGKGLTSLVDCAEPQYGCPRCAAFDLGSNRFVRVMSTDGLGATSYGLVPYRTVAVKQDGLPLGTVLYIPAARGLKLPNGKKHDGYFFVGDFGAMQESQIDLYTGAKGLGWRILGSGTAKSRSVTAYVVTDPTVARALKSAHTASAQAALAP
jgi:3D (Asp-Asp-Asp) domain-containing protein